MRTIDQSHLRKFRNSSFKQGDVLKIIMTRHFSVSKRNIVKNYKKHKPKENRYYFKSNTQVLKNIKHWGHIRRFFNSEYELILENKIMLRYKNSTNYKGSDILFEYLIINSVTFLEICLKFCCGIFVKKFPDRAKQLLITVDKKKDLSIQIISNYSFTNIDDIEHVFSTLWGKYYFQVLRHRSEECKSSIGYENERPNGASPLFKKMGMFKQLLGIRNGLVHENKHIKIKSKKVRKNLLTTIYDVIYLTYSEQYESPYNKDTFDEIRPVY